VARQGRGACVGVASEVRERDRRGDRRKPDEVSREEGRNDGADDADLRARPRAEGAIGLGFE